MSAGKHCPRCNTNKPLTDFHRNRSYKDGLSAYCKPCVAERSAQYYRSIRDEYNERRRVARSQGVTLTELKCPTEKPEPPKPRKPPKPQKKYYGEHRNPHTLAERIEMIARRQQAQLAPGG